MWGFSWELSYKRRAGDLLTTNLFRVNKYHGYHKFPVINNSFLHTFYTFSVISEEISSLETIFISLEQIDFSMETQEISLEQQS